VVDSVVDCAETPLAAMRSWQDPRPGYTAAERPGSPARLINHSIGVLFQNHVTAGCVLWRWLRMHR
jgi:hypothetical protein